MRQKTIKHLFFPGPGFHTIEPHLPECLEVVGVKKMMGVRDARISALEFGSD
jgi:hypothetical protein